MINIVNSKKNINDTDFLEFTNNLFEQQEHEDYDYDSDCKRLARLLAFACTANPKKKKTFYVLRFNKGSYSCNS